MILSSRWKTHKEEEKERNAGEEIHDTEGGKNKLNSFQGTENSNFPHYTLKARLPLFKHFPTCLIKLSLFTENCKWYERVIFFSWWTRSCFLIHYQFVPDRFWMLQIKGPTKQILLEMDVVCERWVLLTPQTRITNSSHSFTQWDISTNFIQV